MILLTAALNRVALLRTVKKGEDFEFSASETGVYGEDGSVYFNENGKVNYQYDSMEDFIAAHCYHKSVTHGESYYVGSRDDDGVITWVDEEYPLDSLDPEENGSSVYLKYFIIVGGESSESMPAN